MSEGKRAAVEGSRRYLMPDRVAAFERLGVPLVIGRRDGYRIWDLDGHELYDFHLNGGTFNLGHRHPEIVRALTDALADYDIGNHHFPSAPRSELAADLVAVSPGGALGRVVFTASASEAVDVAIKSARRATGRRRIVAFDCAFHGRSGFSGAAGDPANAESFLSDLPDDFVTVPYGDLDALAAALAGDDVAAFLAEVLPATAGFPQPPAGYYAGARAVCDAQGTLFIADEVQTGLGRTGTVWAIEGFGVQPDVLVTGKGLSGGIYPIAAVLLGERAGAWLDDDGWGHVSTFGGAELGCVVGRRALALSTAPATLAHAGTLAAIFAERFAALRAENPFLVDVRQRGLVMGLQFGSRGGALAMTSALYAEGVWAMFSGFDPSVLQWKPGLLLAEADAYDALDRFARALERVEASRA